MTRDPRPYDPMPLTPYTGGPEPESYDPPFAALFNREDVEAFARWAVFTLGPGWNPAIHAEGFIDTDTGRCVFTPEGARRMDRLIEEGYRTIGDGETFDGLFYDEFVRLGWIRYAGAPDDWRPLWAG